MRKKLTLGDDKVFGGVCSGLAEYFNIDIVLVRIIYLVLTFATTFPGLLIYLIMWLCMPRKYE